MRKMGFCMRLSNLMMECVKTVSYSILVNGELKSLIPLSPFLFLLCTKGLHGVIKKVARTSDIRGFN